MTITVTMNGDPITGIIWTEEGPWSTDVKMVSHEIRGGTVDYTYYNGRTSPSCILQGRCLNTEANNITLHTTLTSGVRLVVSSTARGTHGPALVTAVTETRSNGAWVWFTVAVTL